MLCFVPSGLVVAPLKYLETEIKEFQGMFFMAHATNHLFHFETKNSV